MTINQFLFELNQTLAMKKINFELFEDNLNLASAHAEANQYAIDPYFYFTSGRSIHCSNHAWGPSNQSQKD